MPKAVLPAHISVQCRVYRATSYDVPLRVAANRRSGRWNVAGASPVQYLCLDAQAPFAETMRHEGLRTEVDVGHYEVTLWELEVNEGIVVDYRTFEKAECAGFPAEALVDDDHERCQVEARRLMNLGAQGVLTPSAALPGSINLTLFGPRVEVRWAAKPGVASAVPAQRLVAGHPPAELIHRVRYFGDQHRQLSAYLDTQAKRSRR
jgi:RES domain-containing protein